MPSFRAKFQAKLASRELCQASGEAKS